MQYAFKPIGAAFIMLCCYLVSFFISSRAKREIAELEAFILLINRIRTDIACFSRPLYEIYTSFEADALERSGFLKMLRELGLNEALKMSENRLTLHGDDLDVIKQFAAVIGKSYRDEEIKTCDYYISQLSERYKMHYDEFPKKNKLNRSLCVMFGVSLIIILV